MKLKNINLTKYNTPLFTILQKKSRELTLCKPTFYMAVTNTLANQFLNQQKCGFNLGLILSLLKYGLIQYKRNDMNRDEVIEKYEPKHLGGEIGAVQRKDFRERVNKIFDDLEKMKCGNCHFAVNDCTLCEYHTYVDDKTDVYLHRINSEHYCSDWEIKKL